MKRKDQLGRVVMDNKLFYALLVGFTVVAAVVVISITVPSEIKLRSDSDSNQRINSKEKFMTQWRESKVIVEEEKQKTTSANKYQTSEHVAYKQSEYLNTIVGSKTIAKVGCGWCSLTCMMAELNPDMCWEMTPADWLGVMPDNVKAYWAGGNGMGWGAPGAWVSYVNSLGVYGEYRLKVKEGDGSTIDTAKMLSYVKTYGADPNTVIVVSASAGLFTGGGHIMLITEITDDEKYFHITDSSTAAFNTLNAAGEVSSWEEMSSFNFPLDELGYGNKNYSFKGVWVIERLN